MTGGRGQRVVWRDALRGWKIAAAHPLLGRTVARLAPAVCPPRGAPLAPYERNADAVVVSVWRSPGAWGSEFGAYTVFELHWPDGGTTWHRRSEFEPVLPDLPAGV